MENTWNEAMEKWLELQNKKADRETRQIIEEYDKAKSAEKKTIYTRKMALYLRNKGFKILRTIPDQNIPNFFNWVFEDTEELREAMTEYTKAIKSAN